MDQSPRFLEAVSFPQLYRAPTLTGELTAPKKEETVAKPQQSAVRERVLTLPSFDKT